ncbi:Alanine racemase [Anaerohalosphaera lusitana]|uniref:Alanine racemase n=1 Tax=Anaerohalosphaera lusitana TaxID=1936003 RepID=A0A1U9NMP1_9BACT|nr:alanine racemase [Anaerohalosphaera lusitana]AQT69004.1 Alanine racemase [Anaerohalosphaera lusitana]
MRLYRSQRFIRPDLECHISSKALKHNVRNLKSLCKDGTKYCAVVKANAYGHGIAEVVNILKTEDVDFFAVNSFYEALHIDTLIDRQSILIFEAVYPSQPREQILISAERGFHCPVASADAVNFIQDVLEGSSHVFNAHLNIETGMSRCGLDQNEAQTLIDLIDQAPNVRLAGIYTHFATADEVELDYAYEQLRRFEDFLGTASIRKRKDVIIHASNSAATIKMPEANFDMVRCGISMYGYYSRPMTDPPIKLSPTMKLQAPIARLKHIPAGHSVSYGRSFVPYRDTVAAIVPLGYADGYWRCFSNKAPMMVGEHVGKVIGRVCMDQLLLDVTDVPGVAVGQMVTIIDDKHDSPCGGYALADLAETICYEILTSVHAHVSRIVH